MNHVDAVIVRSGPNGLAAAIAIGQTGRKVLVLEAASTIGGGCRSASHGPMKHATDIERDNPNFVGGDIAAGATTLGQLFTRPTWRTYSTPVPGLYICSASTPPGVGVHGMCGYFAAQRALREVLAFD